LFFAFNLIFCFTARISTAKLFYKQAYRLLEFDSQRNNRENHEPSA